MNNYLDLLRDDEDLIGADPMQTPEVIAAREERDKDLALADIGQGLTQIGSGLAGQRADTRVFDSARAAAGQKAKEVTDDSLSKRKLVSDAIKSRSTADKEALAEEWRRKNFEQEERKIGAMLSDKAAQRDKPTDANNLAAGFGKRMEQAEGVFSALDKEGYDRAGIGAAVESSAANIPVLGDLVRAKVLSKNSGLQEQAEKNFLSAVLRRESGASISPTEREEGALQYFPRVGDSPELKAQKAANRRQALEALRASSGTAWDKVPQVGGAEGAPKPAPAPAGAPKKYAPGSVIKVKGKRYRVGADGDSLEAL